MRLPKWQRWFVHGALTFVATSGLIWFLSHDAMELEWAAFDHAALVSHGAAAFTTLIALGSTLPQHVRGGLFGTRNRVAGLLFTAVMGGLVLTGFWLYYGGEETRVFTRWIHLALGLASFIAYPAHIIAGRWRRTAAQARNQPVRRTATVASTKSGRRTASPGALSQTPASKK